MAVATLVATLVGCGKSEDPSKALDVNKTNGTATIIGYIYYNPTQGGANIAVPASNLSPRVTFDNYVYNQSGTTDISANFQYTSSAANPGQYTVKVPAPATGAPMSVTITFNDFAGTRTPNGGAAATTGIWNAPASYFTSATVVAGETCYLDAVSYSFSPSTIINIQ